MAKRRDLEVAFLAALLSIAPGCAGKPVMPWSSKKAPTTMEDLAKSSAPKSSWMDKLSMKPKVIPAQDPTSLGTKQKVGADVFVHSARLHESSGNFDQAEAQYQKALSVAPQDLNALVGLARLHDRQQEFGEAEKLYRQAAKADPQSALVWNDLGLCYARQKRLADAAKTLEQAVALQPKNKMYRNNLATVLVEAGQNDAAWAQLTAVCEPAVAHYNMGYLLGKQQQTDLARQHLTLAIEADPSLDAAAQLLAKLEGRVGTTEELAIEAPSNAAPSYSISDQSVPAGTYQAKQGDQVSIANNEATALTNPLAPSTRRSATYRMPPTLEQAHDPAPQPTRLPEVEVSTSAEGDEGSLPAEGPSDLGNPGGLFPSRRVTHEDDSLRQPKNVIKLLGSEPIAAPIPADE